MADKKKIVINAKIPSQVVDFEDKFPRVARPPTPPPHSLPILGQTTDRCINHHVFQTWYLSSPLVVKGREELGAKGGGGTLFSLLPALRDLWYTEHPLTNSRISTPQKYECAAEIRLSVDLFAELFLNKDELYKLMLFEEQCAESYLQKRAKMFHSTQEERVRGIADR